MSDVSLLKETKKFTDKEHINLIAVPADSIKPSQNASDINSRLKALEGMSKLFSNEELKPVIESIKEGISFIN